MLGNRYWILVVEDDQAHATLIKAVFSHCDPNAHVYHTPSAEEAISYLHYSSHESQVGQGQLPDIVVLDIEMEGIGGIGFLEWYSRHPLMWKVPVVVFTSAEDIDLKHRCLQLGARAFKQKPTDFSELVPIVQRELEIWDPLEMGEQDVG